ncbi:putative signal-transduction protein containing cAMP-binding and CBS domains [Thermoplasmatales archaeon SCGC AB-540-F20]|nr:putative signal-transduction protein containing cAMP-binding and CBS domains [Thermoplasmatales archaeon SCGC AB-540-F20]
MVFFILNQNVFFKISIHNKRFLNLIQIEELLSKNPFLVHCGGIILVSEIMSKDVVTVESDEPVLDACKLYKDRGVGCLVVMKEGIVLGILTERDIIERVILDHRDPNETKVEEIMSKNIQTVHASASVEKAVEIMEEHKIKKLPVILNNEIFGIVTITDIANALPGFSRALNEEIENSKSVKQNSQ